MARRRIEQAAQKADTALDDWRLGIRRLVKPPPVEPEEVRRPGAPAVVVLPGVWERWPATWQWAQSLYEAGFDVHFVPELDLTLGHLDELANRLLAWLESTGLETPIVVAHSKGGLVAKAALVKQPDCLTGLIACGTPFAGAPIARIAPLSMHVRNLRPESAEIRELAEHVGANHRIVAIEASWDQNVPELEDLPGATVLEAPVVGHNHLLEDPETTELVTRVALWIQENWTRVPGPGND